MPRMDGLDDDERAEAEAYESGLPRPPAHGRWLVDEVPMQPGTMLAWRSLWSGAAVVVVIVSMFGAIVHSLYAIAVAGFVLALVMLVRGRGPARRIEVLDDGAVTITGGLWGRTVHLAQFNWAAAYKATPGFPSVRPASTVILHRAGAGRHLGAKVVGVWLPTVSSRRTTIVFSSMWRIPTRGQRVADNLMAEFFRVACRRAGMRVSQGRGGRIWTASRSAA